MAKVMIVYASMTGNTEEIADILGEELEKYDIEVDIEECISVEPDKLLEYDGALIGGYTYDDGELPDEFVDFYEDMSDVDFSGKVCASFGSGDTFYDEFCLTVDLVEKRLKEQGATVPVEGLKVDLDPDEDDVVRAEAYAKTFADALLENLN
ncbi:flavodoxin [Paenilisteria rocourtiae]|uniref:Flavodoxin n=1 Tax=Listeria rocourtiae TaxID=647910 RepID=A0A4R6ZJ15_9LIST|nr:flavodoxin [Listeria rocourtiae]EUJ44505.1 putative flavodoxin [Listeria rocourtiae FSL F6-920]MBC1435531.1 flavodoxin [Listeria rocourtiae]MBC1604854.1 flavodoxin [Listeria rocourtiae]TDR52004.1 flavodoxin short chain [Listeria rocourtiae]